MFEEINNIDHSLLLFFNHLDNPVFDFVMYWVSYKLTWIPFYAYLAYFIYKKYPERFIAILVFIAITIALSDQLASAVLKNAVMRLRPCHDPSISSSVHLVYGYCGGMYGFVSSHASNSFALATFLLLLFGKKYVKLQWVLIAWASIVSFSRIYLGAHFPGDVICGALLGILIATVTGNALMYYERKINRIKIKKERHGNQIT